MLIPIIRRGDACRKRTGLSRHQHLMRDLAKSSEREKAGAFPLRSPKGTVHGIAHQVKPEWWAAVLIPIIRRGDACRKRTGLGRHQHLMRELAKSSERARVSAIPPWVVRGEGLRDRASGEAGMVGCGAHPHHPSAAMPAESAPDSAVTNT